MSLGWIEYGPESSGVRTQFLKRMVDFADGIGKTVQLLYFPPCHSKYNPVERCRGILERHWNGAKLVDAETMLGRAESMAWKGIKRAFTCSPGYFPSLKWMASIAGNKLYFSRFVDGVSGVPLTGVCCLDQGYKFHGGVYSVFHILYFPSFYNLLPFDQAYDM